MCCPEDRVMEVNLASVEELRCDLQAIREKIAEQVSQTERSLHKYIQFELLKAQGYLRNVSAKLAAHMERDGCEQEDQHKFKDLPARRDEGSPAHSASSSAGNSSHRSEGDPSQPEAGAAPLTANDSNKPTKPQPPKPKLTEANGCPPTSKKMSRCDEGRGRSSDRSVAEGSNQVSKVPGKSPLPKCTENVRVPKVHFNGKTPQWHQPSHGNQEGTRVPSALRPADTDKMSGSRKQDLNRQQPNHTEPKSRETHPKRHSVSSESESRDKVNVAKSATARLPLTISGSNNTNYTNVKTRFMRRHQDDEVKALFGL